MEFVEQNIVTKGESAWNKAKYFINHLSPFLFQSHSPLPRLVLMSDEKKEDKGGGEQGRKKTLLPTQQSMSHK